MLLLIVLNNQCNSFNYFFHYFVRRGADFFYKSFRNMGALKKVYNGMLYQFFD
jgi:hypothetical protein